MKAHFNFQHWIILAARYKQVNKMPSLTLQAHRVQQFQVIQRYQWEYTIYFQSYSFCSFIVMNNSIQDMFAN